MLAKPLRAALGSLMIQKQYGDPDRELLEQIKGNPHYQYFIGLPGYHKEFHNVVHSGNERCPHSGSFFAPINCGAVLKVFVAGFPAILRAKMPWRFIGDLMSRHNLTFLNGYALRSELSWTHYRLFMCVENNKARDFNMQEAPL